MMIPKRKTMANTLIKLSIGLTFSFCVEVFYLLKVKR